MRLPYEPYLALRYLRYHRGRTFLSVITLISVAGVTVGAAAMVIALSLMTGFQQDIKHRILSGAAHLDVLGADEPLFGSVEPLLARLRRARGVEAVAPVLFSQAMLVNEKLGSPGYVELLGVDPRAEGKVVQLGRGDPFGVLGRPGPTGLDGIVIGNDLASRLAVGPGDRVRVLVPKVSLTPFVPIPRSRVLEVVGVFRAEATPQNLERAYVSLATARRLLDAEGRASWIEVRLADPRELDRVKAALRSELGASWQVVDMMEQNRDLLKALNTEKVMLFLAIALIVVVASLNIVSTLVLMVADKIKEIGTLTAMGARPPGIAAVFMLQGLAIGLIGTTLGLSLGAGLAWWLDRYRILKLNPDVYYISHVPFTTRPLDVTLVGALALVITFLATIYPAWKAAALDPVEAIRHE